MSNEFQVLVDSDAFIGWLIEQDTNAEKSQSTFIHLKERQTRLVTTNLVVGETATVLSHKVSQELARFFLTEVIEAGEFTVLFVSESLYQEALTIFKGQTKKGTSFVDCANVAVIQHFNIPAIFSFDEVYPKKFNLNVAR